MPVFQRYFRHDMKNTSRIPSTRNVWLRCLTLIIMGLAMFACRSKIEDQIIETHLRHPGEFNINLDNQVKFKARNAMIGRSIISKKGSILEVLVLNPMGSKLLHVSQTGDFVESRFLAPDLIGTDITFIIRDIQWMFFINEPDRPSCQFDQGNMQSYRYTNVTVTDSPDGNSRFLMTRRIQGNGVEVVISYGEYDQFQADWFPRKILLKNILLDYEIEVYVSDYRDVFRDQTIVG